MSNCSIPPDERNLANITSSNITVNLRLFPFPRYQEVSKGSILPSKRKRPIVPSFKKLLKFPILPSNKSLMVTSSQITEMSNHSIVPFTRKCLMPPYSQVTGNVQLVNPPKEQDDSNCSILPSNSKCLVVLSPQIIGNLQLLDPCK